MGYIIQIDGPVLVMQDRTTRRNKRPREKGSTGERKRRLEEKKTKVEYDHKPAARVLKNVCAMAYASEPAVLVGKGSAQRDKEGVS